MSMVRKRDQEGEARGKRGACRGLFAGAACEFGAKNELSSGRTEHGQGMETFGRLADLRQLRRKFCMRIKRKEKRRP